MNILSLFAGIGGFDLAARWMGWRTAAVCEIDPWCRQVLAKNFPDADQHDDICTFDATPYRGTIDLVCGGFPCQPFSTAGKRLGEDDPRALWPQMLRVIRECAPRFVVGENVAGLLSQNGGLAFERVCADLEGAGYVVQPLVLPACGVGAPHRRDRLWIVAHADRQRGQIPASGSLAAEQGLGVLSKTRPTSYSDSERQPQPGGPVAHVGRRPEYGSQEAKESGGDDSVARVGVGASGLDFRPAPALVYDSAPPPHRHGRQPGAEWRLTEPPLRGPNDGLPPGLVRAVSSRAKQLKAYGNSVVPQVVYQIFQAIEATNQTLPQ